MSTDKGKPLALVIGGSLGRLCAGVCLRAAGWRVSIFERSSEPVDDRGAGIVLQSEMLTLLEVGESAFVLRPHTAAAAAKAAADGVALGEVLHDGQNNLAENLCRFETPQLEMGIQLRNYGMRLGDQSQFPHGHLPTG